MYKLVGFMSVYCIVFLALLVAERKLHDEEMITWRWDSSPGTAFCLVYFLAWGVFAYYIYHTMTPEKKDQYMVNTSADTAMVCPEDKFVFFKYFFIIYTIWFIMFPVSIFALRDSAPAFTRENMAWLVNSIRQSLGIAVLAAMWMPWHENMFFPFEKSALMVMASPERADRDQEGDRNSFDGDPLNISIMSQEKIEVRRSMFASGNMAGRARDDGHDRNDDGYNSKPYWN